MEGGRDIAQLAGLPVLPLSSVAFKSTPTRMNPINEFKSPVCSGQVMMRREHKMKPYLCCVPQLSFCRIEREQRLHVCATLLYGAVLSCLFSEQETKEKGGKAEDCANEGRPSLCFSFFPRTPSAECVAIVRELPSIAKNN